MERQLTFIIHLRNLRLPQYAYHVDEFEILENIKYLHLIRYSGEDSMYNLDDIMCYFYNEEKKE